MQFHAIYTHLMRVTRCSLCGLRVSRGAVYAISAILWSMRGRRCGKALIQRWPGPRPSLGASPLLHSPLFF
jgi:hypothetical protein